MATSERSKKTPLVKQIAERILEFDSQSIPADVATHAKALILDSLGCALAAGKEHAYERALHTFEAIGGNADCTIIGSRHRMPVTSAVMLNGILIRELDLNDAYVGPGQMGHPSDNIAVALSVGEKQGSSGLDVLASVIAGYELYCRIQDIIVGRGPWDHVTASALAAPAIAGRLLKLDADQLRQCVGAIGGPWKYPVCGSFRTTFECQGNGQCLRGLPRDALQLARIPGHHRAAIDL